MESPFNDNEKRFLLAEMIKVSSMDVGVLVDLIRSHGIQPDWMNMQLPGRRTVGQCLHAAETMLSMPMALPSPLAGSMKRKSVGELSDYGPNKRQAMSSPGELSPRGFALAAQSAPATAQPVNIQPRPNGYAPVLQPPPPSVSATPYNPSPATRRRGRPPKSAQTSWQISTYPSISPAPSAPQPNSPGLQSHATHQPAAQSPVEPKQRAAKKPLPEIAPRPVQATAALPTMEPGDRSPAVPGAEYQSWREETARRDNYQLQTSESHARERNISSYTPIQPRPRSPFPPSRDAPRASSREPRRYTATPPPAVQEPASKENQVTTAEQDKT
ncbi:hypothetical protein VTH82DRAFT_1152 [Thermothelomyces myriococcoides]